MLRLGGERVEAGHRVQGIFCCFLSCSEPQQPVHDIAAAVAGVCVAAPSAVPFLCLFAVVQHGCMLGAQVYITCCLVWPCQGNHQFPMGRFHVTVCSCADGMFDAAVYSAATTNEAAATLLQSMAEPSGLPCKHADPLLKAVWWVSLTQSKELGQWLGPAADQEDIKCR